MTGQQSHNPLDKRGKANHDVYPYNGVWIIEQETFSIALTNVLVDIRSTTVMLRGSNDMVFK